MRGCGRHIKLDVCLRITRREHCVLKGHGDSVLAAEGPVVAVRAEAHESGDVVFEGRALTALADVAMGRDGDPDRAAELASLGLELLPDEEVDARIDALRQLAAAAWWPGDLQRAERYTRDAINVAREAGRQDLWVRAMGLGSRWRAIAAWHKAHLNLAHRQQPVATRMIM